MEVRGDWHFWFDTFDSIKFIAVTHGSCWMSVEGEPAPFRIESGSVIMLSARRRFALASNLSVPAREGTGIFTASAPIALLDEPHWNFQAVCGHVALDSKRGRLLADALPATVRVGRNAPEASKMRWFLDELIVELNERRPGSELAAEELAQLLLLQIIRAHAASPGSQVPGWIGAMADERIATAVRLMHKEPAKAWRVETLAAAVQMSRTSFAVRFSKALGIPPVTYLNNWRMHLAEQTLRSGASNIGQIARALGYRSDSAFSAAFRRAFGVSPKIYRSTATLA